MEAHEKGLEAARNLLVMADGDAYPWDHVEACIKAYLSASNKVLVPLEPSPQEQWTAAMRYRHDAGLLPDTDRQALVRTAHWWHDAWVNSIPNPFKDK